MKTDKQLQADVSAELAWEPSIDSAQIGVEVKDGIVTLAGHVKSYAEKHSAEQTALRVFGVLGLAIELEVKLPGLSKRSDADIASTAQAMLRWVTYIPNDHVQVMVEDGYITLTGELQWEYQRLSIVAAVRHLMGVKGVHDHMTLKHTLTSKAVKSDIEAALLRRAKTDASHISVAVSGGKVTLTGTASNWSERDLAERTAWSSPGVTRVVDEITVAY